MVCAAGGAELIEAAAGSTGASASGGFRIGARNWAILRKLSFKHGIRIAAHDVGGKSTRNLALDLATGEVAVFGGGQRKTLWSGATMPRKKAS